jgi:predicted dehydrogenase
MSEVINWGVIGCGGIARRRTIPEGIVPAETARLVSVYDTDADSNLEVAQQFSAKACRTLDELLGSTIDAVYVASPAGCHYEHVAAAATAGKHVLCEKPLTLDPSQTREMVEFCRQKGVTLGTAFMMRFQTQHQAALALIREGRLGRPVFGRAQLSCWYPPIEGAWRQTPATGGGGSLMDMGGHCIDLLEMFLGPLKQVRCAINNTVHEYRSEDSAVATLSFENGALGVVDTFFCIPDVASKNALELYGSRGSILARGTIGQGEAGEMVACLEPDSSSYNSQQSRPEAEGLEIKPTPRNTYRAEIEEFSQAVIEGREPSINAELGIRSQKVLAACYESVRTGLAVDISQ